MSQAIYCDRCGKLFPAHEIFKAELSTLIPDEELIITSRYAKSERFRKDLCAECAADISGYFNRETREVARGTKN